MEVYFPGEKDLIMRLLQDNDEEKLQSLLALYDLGDYEFDFSSKNMPNQLLSIAVAVAKTDETHVLDYIPSAFHKDMIVLLSKKVLETYKEMQKT